MTDLERDPERLFAAPAVELERRRDGTLLLRCTQPLGRYARCVGEFLERWGRAFAGFCQHYPAFLDCALSLMRRPAQELHDMVSESVWFRLGQAIGSCVHHVSQLLADGTAAGVFAVEDPDFTANVLWTQTLGTMHLARSGVGVKQVAPEIPALFAIAPERAIDSCVAAALAAAGVRH